jgi:hypothetical protein
MLTKGEQVDNVAKLFVILVLVILKLLITGFCLAIGFKMGYLAMDKAQEAINKRKAKATPTAA